MATPRSTLAQIAHKREGGCQELLGTSRLFPIQKHHHCCRLPDEPLRIAKCAWAKSTSCNTCRLLQSAASSDDPHHARSEAGAPPPGTMIWAVEWAHSPHRTSRRTSPQWLIPQPASAWGATACQGGQTCHQHQARSRRRPPETPTAARAATARPWYRNTDTSSTGSEKPSGRCCWMLVVPRLEFSRLLDGIARQSQSLRGRSRSTRVGDWRREPGPWHGRWDRSAIMFGLGCAGRDCGRRRRCSDYLLRARVGALLRRLRLLFGLGWMCEWRGGCIGGRGLSVPSRGSRLVGPLRCGSGARAGLHSLGSGLIGSKRCWEGALVKGSGTTFNTAGWLVWTYR